MMRTSLLVLCALCGASCASGSPGTGSGLPAFDPLAYVTMPKDPSEARRMVRLLNLLPNSPDHAGLADSPQGSVEQLGRPGLALLGIEIREHGIQSSDCLHFVQNHSGEALLCPSLFEKVVRWKSEGSTGRLTLAFLSKGFDGMKTPAEQELYQVVNCITMFGKNLVPYLRECLKCEDVGVRQIAWDLLNLASFNGSDELVYQEALDRSKRESTDWGRSADSFASWWDENGRKQGWIPKTYSFKSP